MSLALSRIEIEIAGSDPLKLARALLAQLPAFTGPVPIEAIARALDIVSIELASLTGIEGCLQCDPLKSEGQIVVNAKSPPRRRRYTIAHELGHFLNERHKPTIDLRFACTAEDLATPRRTGSHQRQETEANIFAIEVLTPRTALGQFLKPHAELDHALALAKAFDISREAAVRRYVALQGECIAAVFSKDGRVRYIEKGDDFPATTAWNGNALAGNLRRSPPGKLTTLDEASAPMWLRWPNGITLFAQTLYQADGFAVTLLVAERDRSD
jgi:hypothetical protein